MTSFSNFFNSTFIIFLGILVFTFIAIMMRPSDYI